MIAWVLALAAAAEPMLEPTYAYVERAGHACAGSRCVEGTHGAPGRVIAREEGASLLVQDELSLVVPARSAAWVVRSPHVAASGVGAGFEVSPGAVLASFVDGTAAWNDDGVCVRAALPAASVAHAAPIVPLPPIVSAIDVVQPTTLWSTPDGGEPIAVLGCNRESPFIDQQAVGTDIVQASRQQWAADVLERRHGAVRVRVHGVFTEVTGWVSPERVQVHERWVDPRWTYSVDYLMGGARRRLAPRAAVALDRPGGVGIGQPPIFHPRCPAEVAGAWCLTEASTSWGRFPVYLPPAVDNRPGRTDGVAVLARLTASPAIEVHDGTSCRAGRWIAAAPDRGYLLVEGREVADIALTGEPVPDDGVAHGAPVLVSVPGRAGEPGELWYAASDEIEEVFVGSERWVLKDRPCEHGDPVADRVQLEVRQIRQCLDEADVEVLLLVSSSASNQRSVYLATTAFLEADGRSRAGWQVPTRGAVRAGDVEVSPVGFDASGTVAGSFYVLDEGAQLDGWVELAAPLPSSPTVTVDLELDLPLGDGPTTTIDARATLQRTLDDGACRVWTR